VWVSDIVIIVVDGETHYEGGLMCKKCCLAAGKTGIPA
jgi:hypothetical protein